jgi:hypothetical protein
LKFKILNGADLSTIEATIRGGGRQDPDLGVGSDTLPSSDVTALVQALDDYNNGVTGPVIALNKQ